MSLDDDSISVLTGPVYVAAGVLMTRYGLDEQSAYARIAEEWAARDLPLADVARQLREEAVNGGG